MFFLVVLLTFINRNTEAVSQVRSSQILQISQVNIYLESVFKVEGLQAFFLDFCEIFKNTFIYRTPPMALSISTNYLLRMNLFVPMFSVMSRMSSSYLQKLM